MKKAGVAFLLFILIPGIGLAGEEPDRTIEPQFPLELSFINQAVSSTMDSFPFGELFDILHPGFSLGTEYAYIQGRHIRLYQGVQGGYYFNKYAAKAFFIQTSLGFRTTLGFGLFVDVGLGLGYLRSFHPVEVWGLNSQGSYERVTDKGKGATLASLGLSLGFDFGRTTGWPVSIFVRYQPYLQTPYSLDEGELLQSWFQLGMRVHLL